MRFDSSALRAITRITILTGLAALSTACLAQFSIRSMPPEFIQLNKNYEPNVVRAIPEGHVIDTRDFFPQINDTLYSQKAFKPDNPRPRIDFRTNRTNSLKPGDMTGGSFAVPNAKFPGLSFTGGVPPDVHMAVGPGHIVQVTNSSIGIYKKSDGQPLMVQTSRDFFAGTGATSFQFDPRVLYDQFNERWIILFLVVDFGGEASEFLIAVSDDSDPVGSWTQYLVDNELTVGSTDYWLDYPMVGYNEDAVAFSGNMFGYAGGGAGGEIYIIPTADLYDGTGGANMFGFNPGVWSIQMADGYSSGTGHIYGIAETSSTSMRVFAIGDLTTATPTLTSTSISVPQWNGAGSAPSGASGSLDTLGDRLMDASYRSGSLVAAHTIRTPDGSAGMVRWYEFDLGDWPASGSTSLKQSGNIELPGDQWSLLPAISMNSFGDISVMYTRSSPSIFSDLVISSRTVSDPAGTIGDPVFIRAGIAPSDRSGGRWGDYFAVVIDPDDDATFWGSGEVTTANGLWTTEVTNWQVTTGGPGGGGGIQYEANAASTYLGNYFAGGTADLIASDNGFYDVDSAFIAGRGHYAAFQSDFTINEPALGLDKIAFTIETMVEPGRGATGMMFLYNWTTGEFDFQKAYRIRPQGNDVKSFSLNNNFSDYISGAGAVRMVVRAHDPFRRNGSTPEPFRLRADFVRLSVFPIS